MKKRSGKLAIWSVAALVGAMGFGIGMPNVTVAQSPLGQPEATSEESALAEVASLNQRAEELYQQGKYAEAIPLAEKALAIQRKMLGDTHPDIAISLNNLALLYHHQGRYAEAELLYQQSLEIRKQHFGDTHPNVATSLNNLAELYRDQGRYAEAEPLFQQSLEIRKQHFRETHPDVANSLHNLAVFYQDQGQYAEAEPLFQQSLEILRQQLGNTHPVVAYSLNSLAILYQDQGQYAEAEPLFQQSLEIRKQHLGDAHPDVANSLNNLALLYQHQGRYAEAEPLYQKALEIRKQHFGDAHPDVANSLNNLAAFYRAQGRYAEAEPFYQQSLETLKQHLGETHPDVANSLNTLATLYLEQGRYTEAEPLFQQSLEILKQIRDIHPDVATSLNNLALLYQHQGKYTEAESLYQQSLEILKQHLGNIHPNVASSLNSLATLYQTQGKYAEAESLFQQSLEILKQIGDIHPNVANSLNSLATLYQTQGRYAEAEPLYQQSLKIRKQHSGETHPDVATSLNNLALLYQAQGRYAEAESLFQQSLEIRKQHSGETHPDVANSLNNLAAFYRAQGRYAEAEPFFQQSLEILKQHFGDAHPDVATSLNNLALLYRAQGRYAEAEPLYQQSLKIRKQHLGDNHPDVATTLHNLALLRFSLERTDQAIKSFTTGLRIEEYNLSQNLIAGSEQQKRDYMATISGTTDVAVSLPFQTSSINPTAVRLGFNTILQRKGRILDVLTNNLQILRQRLDDPESQTLLAELEKVYTQRSNLTFQKPEDIVSPEAHQAQLAELDAKARQLDNQISRRSAEYRNLSQPITLEAVQKLIPAEGALVELVRYQPFDAKASPDQRWDKPRYAAYVLHSQGEPQAIDLGEAEAIDREVNKLRRYLRNPRVPIQQLKASARKLDERVMQPVRQLLGDTRTILLSPDAALNLIPFETLVDENNQYLVENYSLSYLTSGRDLLRFQTAKTKQQPSIVVANPSYQRESQAVALDALRSVSLSERVFLPLEGTQQEADAIDELFADTLVLTKAEATENALKQVENPEFLHIATHGFFLSSPGSETDLNIDNPLLRSGLVFAGVELGQSGGDDGILTAYEAALLDLVGTQLVVLSACDIGVGDITAGEGIYGLRRAFAIAGSKSQLISLWKVEDTATKELMVAYYKRLRAGGGRSEALYQTQRDWLTGKEGEKFQHPYYWASFIPSGDWSPIEFNSSK